jgi:prepilin-type N-terminal cleavage/methylation domain-containing protein
MRRSQNGFTLVELLVVIGIIAMLAVMAGGNYLTSLRRGRNAARISNVKKVQDGFEQYYIGHDSSYRTTGGGVNCEEMLVDTVFPDQWPIQNAVDGYFCSTPDVDQYCVCTALEEVTAGERPGANSAGPACDFATVPHDHFCLVNLQ